MLRLLAVCVLVVHSLHSQTLGRGEDRVLMLGDVNLGREVGQRILEGDSTYPFRGLARLLEGADLVVVNLESPLTDQGGETRHPTDGYRFCGPRSGAAVLALAGVDVAVTANNHAYDYGRRGLLETLSALEAARITSVGTGTGRNATRSRAVRTVNGRRVGFVAYTEFVNMPGAWSGSISVFDRGRARDDIRRLRADCDLVVAQYHGGTEYTQGPPAGTLRNLRALASAGADVVIGHHPHVPQGAELHDSALVLYSLGNAVFYQPQKYWTQIGLAACLHLAGTSRTPGLVHVLPFRAGLQPAQELDATDIDSLNRRFSGASPLPLRREGSSFIVRTYDHSFF